MSGGVRVLQQAEIRRAIGPAEALGAVRDGLVALHRGEVEMPPGMTFAFNDGRDDTHVKGAHVHGAAIWTLKASAGFYDNATHGLPSSSGLSLTFSALTGRLDSILLDDGYLTDLRTGAAGALAADLLARPVVRHALIVGAGGQARFQLDALLGVRRPERVSVFARRPEQVAELIAELQPRHDVPIAAAPDLHAAAVEADLIVTTTPARAPLLQAAWIAPGTHVTAVGADTPGKQELDSALLARAAVIASDLPAVALRHGEASHALAAGELEPAGVVALGALAAGEHPGRTHEDQITIADLVGTGVADTAVASRLLELLGPAGDAAPIHE
jgi:ornithine cyclodeaminase